MLKALFRRAVLAGLLGLGLDPALAQVTGTPISGLPVAPSVNTQTDYAVGIVQTIVNGLPVYKTSRVPLGQLVGPQGTPAYLTGINVTTLPAGSQATASLGGGAPNYVLTLGLPQGPAGAAAVSGAFTVGHFVVANSATGMSLVDGGAPGSAAFKPIGFFLQTANNLSEIAAAGTGAQATARANLALAAVAASGSASDLGAGTLPAARLPAPTASTLGGVKSLTPVANLFLTGVDTAGNHVAAQPSFANLSGSATAAQMPALTGDVMSPAGSTATTLAASGVAAGTYGSATTIPVVTVDAKGRVTTASTLPAAGTGTVTTSGSPTAGNLALFSSPTAITGSTAAQGLTSLGLNNAGQNTFRNRLINGGFSVNQRGYVSGTALAPGVYGHDRWKAAGASGYTTFTQTYPQTTITIGGTGTTLVQIVEAVNIEGGSYTLSWTGTSTCRVYQGTAPAFAASPIVVTGFAANTVTTVECGTGTLGTVQLEPGTAASAFEARPYATELALCQRYYEQFAVPLIQSPVAGNAVYPWSFKVQKRGTPTLATVTAPTYFGGASGAAPTGTTVDGVGLQYIAAGTGSYITGWVVSVSAEL